MTRLDQSTLAHHFEVALAGASSNLLVDLQHSDRYRRSAAASTLSHYLADRMRCFEIVGEDPVVPDHPSLFADQSS